MLIKCLDNETYHVLVKEKEVDIMNSRGDLSSMSLGAFLYALRNGIFKELK